MNPLALYDTSFPLTHVTITVERGPHSDSMSLSCCPLAFVVLAVDPSKRALAFFFICPKATDISSMLGELVTLNFGAIDPMALKEIPCFDLNSESFLLASLHLSEVKAITGEIH